jgi:hypothetical protein
MQRGLPNAILHIHLILLASGEKEPRSCGIEAAGSHVYRGNFGSLGLPELQRDLMMPIWCNPHLRRYVLNGMQCRITTERR